MNVCDKIKALYNTEKPGEEHLQRLRPNKPGGQQLHNEGSLSFYSGTKLVTLISIFFFILSYRWLDGVVAARRKPAPTPARRRAELAQQAESVGWREETQTKLISDRTPFTFIHVPKTGGKTIAAELRHAGYNFSEIHVRYRLRHPKGIKLRSDKNYVLSIRNPLCRWVSAFNYLYLKNYTAAILGLEEGKTDFFRRWQTPNRLAENLYDELGHIDSKHIPTGLKIVIYAYLRGLKNDTKVLGVIMQETLAEDMKRLFNITVRSHVNTNRDKKFSKFLSSKAKYNLHEHLAADFKSLEQLEGMKLLTSEQVKQYKTDHEC